MELKIYQILIFFKENSAIFADKRHQTMKRNGLYGGKSKKEDGCYKFLCENFGDQNIERQLRINNWDIDFYIKSLNLYIQYDGLFWHGLKHTLDELLNSNKPRLSGIYKTYLRDREQEKWFIENNKNLLRIIENSDLEYIFSSFIKNGTSSF